MHRFPRRPTLNQALIGAVFLALLPFTAVGILQGVWNRDYAREIIGERLVASTVATANAQREPFQMARRMIMSFAIDPDVANATPQCSEVLRRGLRVQRSALNFARWDANGVALCSALPFAGSLSVADEPWWRNGVAQKGISISRPLIGPIAGREIIVTMLPLTGPDGKFEGAISAGIDVSWLRSALTRRQHSRQAVAAIVDGQGRTLVASGAGKLPDIVLAGAIGKPSIVKSRDGAEWMYSAAPLFGDQIYIVYAELQQSLLSPSRDQLRMGLILPIFAILLTCLAVWAAVSFFAARWLRLLGAQARKIASGDYTRDRVRFTKAPAEIAALAEDLSNMAQAIEERDAALRASAASNEAMAREVNHRVKNNLQMVMSLLSLQAARVRDPEAKRALDQTRVRMGAVALIHRVLYELSDSSERGTVDMMQLVPELCAQLRKSFPRPEVDLECRSSMGEVPVDHAIPLTLFIVEAVSNSYRHAFADDARGSIVVSVDGDERVGDVRIVDNGIGYSGERSAEAMGIELMEAYASQAQGALAIVSAAGKGSEVTLTYARPR